MYTVHLTTLFLWNVQDQSKLTCESDGQLIDVGEVGSFQKVKYVLAWSGPNWIPALLSMIYISKIQHTYSKCLNCPAKSTLRQNALTVRTT